jgi:trehalose 2-sulfotransferase
MERPRADPATMARIRDYTSSVRDLPETPVRMRYLVLSQPRTGGTFLCEALERSGEAGIPTEYLNPAAILAMTRRLKRGPVTLRRLMQELERRRTTSNGLFGLHLHLEQLRKPLQSGERSIEWMRRFDRVIMLYRRDKLAQAISLDRALQTSAWFRDEGNDTTTETSAIEVRPSRIVAHLTRLFEQEAIMRRSVEALAKPVLEIDYESLDTDFAGIWLKVTKFLDISPVPAAAVYPTLQRMRDAASDAIVERFLAMLRDSDLARDSAQNSVVLAGTNMAKR